MERGVIKHAVGVIDDIGFKRDLEVFKNEGDEVSERKRGKGTKVYHVVEDDTGPVYGKGTEDGIEKKRDFIDNKSPRRQLGDYVGGKNFGQQ